MNNDIVISVKDINKSFKVYKDKSHNLRDKFIYLGKRDEKKYRQVIKNMSFDVHKGETVGFVGKNGCGKSTTLKLLTKILRPDSGSIDVSGKVCALIELGAGFHPDMSGRENIYINASIFGIKKKEVDKKLKDIIEFSELEKFIDEPVRTYSSGMYMRLAFSVAINVDADILLIDEILAVGDATFQKKCFEKMKELKEKGTTMVLVSHSLEKVKAICDRVIWIESGEIKEDGDCEKVVGHYLGTV